MHNTNTVSGLPVPRLWIVRHSADCNPGTKSNSRLNAVGALSTPPGKTNGHIWRQKHLKKSRNASNASLIYSEDQLALNVFWEQLRMSGAIEELNRPFHDRV